MPMMVSDFVSSVAHVLNLNMDGTVFMIIVSLAMGAVTHKVASIIQNNIVFVVCALLLYLFWYASLNDSVPAMQVPLTVCLVVAGREGYKRLLYRSRY